MAGPSKRAEALTPRAIVEELDRYIVGQREAKRAVAAPASVFRSARCTPPRGWSSKRFS